MKQNEKINWEEIQTIHDNGVYWSNLPNVTNIGRVALQNAERSGLLKKVIHKKVMSEDSKKRISIGRKKYLKENPETHPWRDKNKFISIPCEFLKNKLKENNIPFIEEYQPFLDINRYFSIDISFPDKKIGIEVNGNQHYDKNGNLKKYYQERHDFFKLNGWNLIEIHYSTVYNIDVKDILKFDYSNLDYIKFIESQKNKKKKLYYCSCGNEKSKNSKQCKNCQSFSYRKVDRPEIEILKKEIEELGYSAVGKKYGVSDNAIRKWLK